MTDELEFDLRVKSNKKIIDKVKGDWKDIEKTINDKYYGLGDDKE